MKPVARGCSSDLSKADDGSNRFAKEFEGAAVIGQGNFAVVYRARNRIDKQEYAIKKTKNALMRGTTHRDCILQEALALAAVAHECPYIVGYFGAWIEDDRLFIQTELCDESLKDSMISLRKSRPHDPRLSSKELAGVLRDVSKGLCVLHAKNLVHLDIKPENVLVKRLTPSPSRDSATSSRVYKIADLGLATAAMNSNCDEISEGDSRYLARELLQGDFSDLTKADVFSLGLMSYELATNPKGLPCNGEEWHQLRQGNLQVNFCDQLSPELIALIQKLIHPVAAQRPPCSDVLEDPVVGRGEVVEALQQQVRQSTERAQAAEKKAASYWSELMHLKRQELCREGHDDDEAALLFSRLSKLDEKEQPQDAVQRSPRLARANSAPSERASISWT